MTSFRSRSARSKSSHRPVPCRLQCEQLETRLALTAHVVNGTTAVDTFQVFPDGDHVVVRRLGVIPGSYEDTIAYSGDTCTVNGQGGNDTFIVSDVLPANIQITLDGEPDSSSEHRARLLTRGTTGRTWDITGPDSGTLGPWITFRNIDDLQCETFAGDRFVMHPGGSISHSIHGGNNERSVLDYSLRSTGVRVNLSTNAESVTLANGAAITLPARTAPGIAPVGTDATTGILALRGAIGTNTSDVLVGSAGVNILRGGGGNDDLFGRGGEDILIGGDGNDRLFGDGGRDILIGGRSSGAGASGTDRLNGGNGEDILIGGYTTFDANGNSSLLRILGVWSMETSYESRVTTLRMTSTTAAPSLGGTVFDDLGNDRLTGGQGRDWFHTEPARSVPLFGTWQYDLILDLGFNRDGEPLVMEFVD